MNSLYDIYTYHLEDNTYLLYPKPLWFNADSDKNLMDECGFLYQEIVDNNPIVYLDNIKKNVAGWEIDAFVHMTMHDHGIERVRGGRYNTKILSESAKDEISNAIKYMSYGLNDQFNCINKFYKYRETIECEEIYMNKINQYEVIEERRKRYETNRTLVHELNWLMRIIRSEVGSFFDIKDRYYGLMRKMGVMYKQYLAVVEDAPEQVRKMRSAYNNCADCDIYFTVPHVFFDSRVIPTERAIHKYNFDADIQLKCVFSIFELALYTLINREDEEIFELNQIDIRENKDKLFIAKHSKNLSM
jgi:hypothetical protein